MTLIDHNRLAELRELAAGDEAFIASLIEAFLPQLRVTPGDLRQALDDKDARKIVKLAHTLKGSASNVGAQAVERLCGTIEELVRGGDLRKTAPLLRELEWTAAATQRALEIERSRAAG